VEIGNMTNVLAIRIAVKPNRPRFKNAEWIFSFSVFGPSVAEMSSAPVPVAMAVCG